MYVKEKDLVDNTIATPNAVLIGIHQDHKIIHVNLHVPKCWIVENTHVDKIAIWDCVKNAQ